MKSYLFPIVLSVLLGSVSMDVTSAELVGRFTGSGSGETAEFEVRAPWLLDWRVNGDFPQMLAIEVSLIEARSGTHAGYVLKTKQRGNGVRLFQEGGLFRLKVDATLAEWILKVEQLSRDEAEQYTPREKPNQ